MVYYFTQNFQKKLIKKTDGNLKNKKDKTKIKQELGLTFHRIQRKVFRFLIVIPFLTFVIRLILNDLYHSIFFMICQKN